MSTEALRKAVEAPGFDFTISDGPDTRILTWHKKGCRPAWETECAMWDALATHRANYDALVIRLGEVTTRLEAADAALAQVHKDLGHELRDPNGTIWQECVRLQKENERLKKDRKCRHMFGADGGGSSCYLCGQANPRSHA